VNPNTQKQPVVEIYKKKEEGGGGGEMLFETRK
jgi:hypothetical protein